MLIEPDDLDSSTEDFQMNPDPNFWRGIRFCVLILLPLFFIYSIEKYVDMKQRFNECRNSLNKHLRSCKWVKEQHKVGKVEMFFGSGVMITTKDYDFYVEKA